MARDLRMPIETDRGLREWEGSGTMPPELIEDRGVADLDRTAPRSTRSAIFSSAAASPRPSRCARRATRRRRCPIPSGARPRYTWVRSPRGRRPRQHLRQGRVGRDAMLNRVSHDVKSGTDAIRQALAVRRYSLAGIAKAVGIAPSRLDNFMRGGPELCPKYLRRLTDELWSGRFSFNCEEDALESTNPPARPLHWYSPCDVETTIKSTTIKGQPVTSSFKLSDGRSRSRPSPMQESGWAAA